MLVTYTTFALTQLQSYRDPRIASRRVLHLRIREHPYCVCVYPSPGRVSRTRHTRLAAGSLICMRVLSCRVEESHAMLNPILHCRTVLL